jgi:hypothetical protein
MEPANCADILRPQATRTHTSEMHTSSSLLRHLVGTLAYRAAKAVRDVPADFASASFGPATRRPVLIVAHLADLMSWAITMTQDDVRWKAEGTDDWNTEVNRFFAGLFILDRMLEERSLADTVVEQLIQGPLADALTHVGQLALLRGMAGYPLKPESFARAEIVRGRVGLEQAPARREFEGDASAPRQ